MVFQARTTLKSVLALSELLGVEIDEQDAQLRNLFCLGFKIGWRCALIAEEVK